MGHVGGRDHAHLRAVIGYGRRGGLATALVLVAWVSHALISHPAAATQRASDPLTVEPEVPVTATDLSLITANNSPVLAADPTDGRFVVAAHRFDSPSFGCGLQVSGDGGRGWIGVEPVPTVPAPAERCYAPEVVFDRHGTLYYLFIGLAGEGNLPAGVFLTTSDDRGRSFSPPWQVLGPQNFMVRLAIEPEGGQRGRLHLVWLHASVDPPLGGLASVANPILAAHSNDKGRTFSAPVPVSDTDRPRAVAPSVAVGSDGAVHVAYYDLQNDAVDYQGLEGPAWDGTWSLVMSTSPDRGGHFGPGVVVDDSIVPPGRVMLIYTMPPPAIAVGSADLAYVAWPDARLGGPGVFFSRSLDGGRSWEVPRRLDEDASARSVPRELVRLGVAPDGRVDAAWLDRRNDPENLRYDVYYTYSGDDGRSFAPNVRLSTESSDGRIGQRYRIPSAAGLTELGSRLGLLSRGDDALVAWPDTRNVSIGFNQQDVFAAVVRFPPKGDGGRGGIAILLAVAVVVMAAGGVLVTARARRGRGPRASED